MEFASRFSLLGIVAAVYSSEHYAELQELPARMGLAVHDLLDLGIVYKASAIVECVDATLARDGMRRIQQDTLFESLGDLDPEDGAAPEAEA
jgi:hypothetical protein